MNPLILNKLQSGQSASVALMDARSTATAANKGLLTPATDFDGELKKYKYYFDKTIYKMVALTDNLLLKVVSEIHDPVTTTDELIPSGETSSYK